jgi:predicted oxidoreductase
MPGSAKKILLGSSPLEVGRLAYGCWRIAGTMDPAMVSAERRQAGARAVIAAFEAGYTLFDLADVYCEGRCEEIFGEVLKQVGGMRERIVIATKCGIRFKGDPRPDAPYRYDFSAEHIVRSCEASLKRLGISTLDVLMLHRPDYLADPTEVGRAFSQLHQQGKARHFGVSNFRPSQMAMLQKSCPMPLIVNQVELSLAQLDPFQDGTLDQCLSERITPLAWSPLAGGRLVDSTPVDLHTPDHAHRIRVREVLDQVGRELQTSRLVVALAWLLKHPAGIVPILGSIQPGRIREALRALEIELSREQWYRLLEAVVGHQLA